MQDPIADMLTRIRNGQQAKHKEVTMVSSKIKLAIAKVLKEEGYILDFSVQLMDNNLSSLTLALKYYQGAPVIGKISRVSKPGLRVYRAAKDVPAVPGFGITILSTPKGVMSHTAARAQGVGGELLCQVA